MESPITNNTELLHCEFCENEIVFDCNVVKDGLVCITSSRTNALLTSVNCPSCELTAGKLFEQLLVKV